MNIYNIIGYFLISLPFIGLGVFTVRMGGWKGFFTVVGIFGTIMLLLVVGSYLVTLP